MPWVRSVLAILAGRSLQALIVALVVGIVSFIMMQALPGDAAYRIAAGRYGYDMMDAASADAVRLELGLDRPWWIQLRAWLGELASFDLGRSHVYGSSVIEEVATQLKYSLLLAGGAVVASLLIALPVVAYVGVQGAYLIEGVVIVETVFAWPGIGHALVHAIFGRDVAMVQGTALALGLIYVALNLFIDLTCRMIDPRSS